MEFRCCDVRGLSPQELTGEAKLETPSGNNMTF